MFNLSFFEWMIIGILAFCVFSISHLAAKKFVLFILSFKKTKEDNNA